MKFWEVWVVSGMAVVLIVCSVTFYQYSSTFTFTDSVDTSILVKFLDSGKELHLSKEQTKKLLQHEIAAEKHLSKAMRGLGEALKAFSLILFIFGITQIYLCTLIYQKIKKLRHNKSLE